MQFLMLVCLDNQPVEPPETEGDVEEWVTTMDARGIRLLGNPVQPEFESRAVRVRGGKVMVTDGPFLETKEALAGFDVLECEDMAQAIEVAAAHPMAARGVMDIRPMIGD